jgi:hypothetical protein
MLAKNPQQRITSFDALNHPALTTVLSQSPLHVRNVFDNKSLLKYSNITDKYDQKNINTKKQTKKSYGGIPDKIEDMSPRPMSPGKKKRKTSNPFNNPANGPRPWETRASPNRKSPGGVFGKYG